MLSILRLLYGSCLPAEVLVRGVLRPARRRDHEIGEVNIIKNICCLPGPTTRIGSGTQLIILAQNPRFVNSVIPGYTLVMPELFDPIFEKWQKEQAFFASQKEQHPELFIRTEGLEILEQLTRVGIVLPVQPLVKGFIKYHPFDFIVEERLRSEEHTSEL